MTWNDSLSVGIKSIDEQHERLVNILNELHDGLQARRSRMAMGAVFQKLVAYTVEHFRYEEDLFAKTGYSEMVEHMVEHNELKRQIKALQMKNETSITGVLSTEIIDFLHAWLSDHIQGADRKYISHLTANGVV